MVDLSVKTRKLSILSLLLSLAHVVKNLALFGEVALNILMLRLRNIGVGVLLGLHDEAFLSLESNFGGKSINLILNFFKGGLKAVR